MNQEEIRLAIKIYMAVRKIRLIDLANELGCTAGHLSGVLTGKKPITKKLLNYFKISKKVVFSTTDKEFFAFYFLARDQIRKAENQRLLKAINGDR